MANFYDISKQYTPNPNGDGFITKFNLNPIYDPTLEISTSPEKIKPYTIDLGQSATGIPSVLYSIDLGQSATGTPSVIYTVNTDQSGKGTPAVPYSVNNNQSSTGIFDIPYSINTDQSATGIFDIPYSVNTDQSSTTTFNSYQRPANQSGVGIPSPSFNDFIVQGNVNTSQVSNNIASANK